MDDQGAELKVQGGVGFSHRSLRFQVYIAALPFLLTISQQGSSMDERRQKVFVYS